MPELPEVETVRRTLEQQIIGKTIKNVEVFYERMIEEVTPLEFKASLVGETVRQLYRYGKYLIFIFDHVSIVSHLRMEGKFFLKARSEEVVKHEHVIFNFTDDSTLRYHDTRKFGIMALLKTTSIPEIMNYPTLQKLGEEANVSTNYQGLYDKIKDKNIPIKTLLLDQENLAGLGNIYVDEVCFASRISPLTLGRDLTYEQVVTILDNSRKILKEAIACGGTTIRSYTSSLGVTGRFQQNLFVHTLDGQPCKICHNPIIKTVVGGRGTYLCPTCQKVYQKIMVKIVGITGIIASGKSAITKYLEEQGYYIIDADKISRQLLDNSNKNLAELMNKLTTLWGEQIVNSFYQDGKINRDVLGGLIFQSSNMRKDLNALMHPIVKKIIILTIKQQKNAIIKNNDTAKKIIFVDVPLLYEAHYEDLFDHILIIGSSYETILKRLMVRDKIGEEYAKLKISSQMTLEEKIVAAEKSLVPYTIINNDKTLKMVYRDLEKILKKIK